ncbi:uncharacterized protein LOC142331634 [Lycorma delicatula]|uniref:uncharacterized protein LOC142331634 n=1 Tax=Lycorma delicatula TaxID=130591 RepID=UPI003F516DEF
MNNELKIPSASFYPFIMNNNEEKMVQQLENQASDEIQHELQPVAVDNSDFIINKLPSSVSNSGEDITNRSDHKVTNIVITNSTENNCNENKDVLSESSVSNNDSISNNSSSGDNLEKNEKGEFSLENAINNCIIKTSSSSAALYKENELKTYKAYEVHNRCSKLFSLIFDRNTV